jgi:hypothetical protein
MTQEIAQARRALVRQIAAIDKWMREHEDTSGLTEELLGLQAELRSLPK